MASIGEIADGWDNSGDEGMSSSSSQEEVMVDASLDDRVPPTTPSARSEEEEFMEESHGTCFFADATLDLEEAHDMADTPTHPNRPLVSALQNVVGNPNRRMVDVANISLPALDHGPSIGASLKQRSTTAAVLPTGSDLASVSVSPSAAVDEPLATLPVQSLSLPVTAKSPLESVKVVEGNTDMHRISHSSDIAATHRPKLPRRPRDLVWAISAVCFIPISFIMSFYMAHRNAYPLDSVSHSHVHDYNHHYLPSVVQAGTYGQSHTVTIICTILSAVASTGLARLLYLSQGGGDGENARHLVSSIIVNSHLVSLAVHPLLVALIYVKCPSAGSFFLWIPLFFFIRDMVKLRQSGEWFHLFGSNSTTTVNRNRARSSNPNTMTADDMMTDMGDGRKTFFRALANAALDILSRSCLKRKPFYRAVSMGILVQLGVVLLWRSALLKSLSISYTFSGKLMLLVSYVGGVWATGIVARTLGLIASGGVASWFAQQTIWMEEMNQNVTPATTPQRQNSSAMSTTSSQSVTSRDTASDDFNVVGYNDGLASYNMPEAYRSAAASAYKPVLDFDGDVNDDDDDYFDDFDDDGLDGTFVSNNFGNRKAVHIGTRPQAATQTHGDWANNGTGSAVRSFFLAAATVSFGSVAQCGLLGGLAQLMWSGIRNVDAIVARFFGSRNSGFRGMDIGGTSPYHISTVSKIAVAMAQKTDHTTRSFVRNHHDLAMSHVAAYYKSYRRAAQDVSALIDSSGIQPIIHDDISTHMCASVCTAISGMIVIFVGFILSHHRKASSLPSLHDTAVCEIMLLSFILSYTIVFTVLEPLRASIKTVYVCFAQHPQSLSQAFPLIFHRLTRLSETNLV